MPHIEKINTRDHSQDHRRHLLVEWIFYQSEEYQKNADMQAAASTS